MAYKRYKSSIALSKPEKVILMAEYINYYENLAKEKGVDVLNLNIPREVFNEVLDSIGTLLNEYAIKMANERGAVKDFFYKKILYHPMCKNYYQMNSERLHCFLTL